MALWKVPALQLQDTQACPVWGCQHPRGIAAMSGGRAGAPELEQGWWTAGWWRAAWRLVGGCMSGGFGGGRFGVGKVGSTSGPGLLWLGTAPRRPASSEAFKYLTPVVVAGCGGSSHTALL